MKLIDEDTPSRSPTQAPEANRAEWVLMLRNCKLVVRYFAESPSLGFRESLRFGRIRLNRNLGHDENFDRS